MQPVSVHPNRIVYDKPVCCSGTNCSDRTIALTITKVRGTHENEKVWVDRSSYNLRCRAEVQWFQWDIDRIARNDTMVADLDVIGHTFPEEKIPWNRWLIGHKMVDRLYVNPSHLCKTRRLVPLLSTIQKKACFTWEWYTNGGTYHGRLLQHMWCCMGVGNMTFVWHDQ